MNVILIDDEPISLLLLKDLFSDSTNVRVYEETSYQKAYQRLLTPIVFDILISFFHKFYIKNLKINK